MIIISSLYENRDITDGLEGLIPLNEGGILASQENLRKAIAYQLSHANDFLKYLYYPTVSPLSEDDFIDENGKFIEGKETVFDEEIKDKILYFEKRIPTNNPDSVKACYFTMDMSCESINGNYAKVNIEMYIMVNEALLSLHDSSSRIARIGIEINKILNHSIGEFIGELKFKSGYDINTPSTYRGYRMIYTATDFNR